MSSETGHRELELLSEYLDGELAGRRRAELERHLAGCAACRVVLEDLRAVAARAAALEPGMPVDDLWPGILARLDARAPASQSGATRLPSRWAGRRFAFSLPQLAAAAALLVVLSGGAVWMLMKSGVPPAAPGNGAVAGRGTTTTPSAAPPLATAPAPTRAFDRRANAYRGNDDAAVTSAAGDGEPDARLASYDLKRYDATIAELQNVIHTHSAELDTSTVRVIEQNLALIDHAIGDARRALEADPANPYLNGHLAQQLQRKVRLLQQATGLVAVHQS